MEALFIGNPAMKFITLYWLIQHHDRECPCGRKSNPSYHHGRCFDSMPRNWVIPHNSRYSLSLMRSTKFMDSKSTEERVIEQGFPEKPCTWKATKDLYDEDPNYWGWGLSWPGHASFVF